MNVALPRQWEDYLRTLLESGGYSGFQEILEEALREHEARRKGIEIFMTPNLEGLLDEGLENLDAAKTTEELRHPS